MGMVLFVAGLWWKAQHEEALLLRQFGPDYRQYRHSTGMFVPRWASR